MSANYIQYNSETNENNMNQKAGFPDPIIFKKLDDHIRTELLVKPLRIDRKRNIIIDGEKPRAEFSFQEMHGNLRKKGTLRSFRAM